MPVDSNGHITAPLSLFTVMQTLGESRTDETTLCTSPKINPYSLIRPFFYKSQNPKILPSQLPQSVNAPLLYTPNNEIPTAVRCDKLPSKDLYDYQTQNPGWLYYAVGKWGYYVPYVTNAADVMALTDAVWIRYTPADDPGFIANGKLTQTWAVLDQFDGYLHNAQPADPVANTKIEYGKNISLAPNTSVGNHTEAQILGTSGKNHPGGVVSIPAVLGTTDGWWGMSVFRKTEVEKKYKLLRHAMKKYQSDSSGLIVIPSLVVSDIPMSEADIIVVPWFLVKGNGNDPVLSSDGQTLTLSPDTRIYGFRFAEQFEGYRQGHISPKHLIFGTAFADLPEYTFSEEDPTHWAITFSISNLYPKYPLTGNQFYLEFNYKSNNGAAKKGRINVNNLSAYNPGDDTTLKVVTATINPTSVEISNSTPKQVKIVFAKPTGNGGLLDCNSDLPTLHKLAMMSIDGNTDKVGNVSVPVILTSTSQPLPLT